MGLATNLPRLEEDCFALFGALRATECIMQNKYEPFKEQLNTKYIESHRDRVFNSTLIIAVKLRSFFDIHSENEKLSNVLSEIDNLQFHGICGQMISPKEEVISFREVCNKLIHSLSANLIDDTVLSIGQPQTIRVNTTVLTDLILLKGKYKGSEWMCRVNLTAFCNQAYEIYFEIKHGSLSPYSETYGTYNPPN